MKESKRKCVKCGASPAEDTQVVLYRFPKPGKSNSLRCELWAKYCFPDRAWPSPKFQSQLHSEHRMLCSNHFEMNSFSDFNKKKLHRHATPVNQIDKIEREREKNSVWITPGPEDRTPSIKSEASDSESSRGTSPTWFTEDAEELIGQVSKIPRKSRKDDADTQDEIDVLEKCILCYKAGREPETNEILLSSFPPDPAICKAWVTRVGVKELFHMSVDDLHEKRFLCKLHFNPGCFIKRGENTLLRAQAVPTENLYFQNLPERMMDKFPAKGVTAAVQVERPNPLEPTDEEIADGYYEVEYLDENTLQSEDALEPAPVLTVSDEPAPVLTVSDKPAPVLSVWDKPASVLTVCDDATVSASANKALNLPADEIDTLFLSYAGTFRKLTRKLQTMLKLDLAKLFARYEMKNSELQELSDDKQPAEKDTLKAAESKRNTAKMNVKNCPKSSVKIKPKILSHVICATTNTRTPNPNESSTKNSRTPHEKESSTTITQTGNPKKSSTSRTAHLNKSTSLKTPVLTNISSKNSKAANSEKVCIKSNVKVLVEPCPSEDVSLDSSVKPSKIRRRT